MQSFFGSLMIGLGSFGVASTLLAASSHAPQQSSLSLPPLACSSPGAPVETEDIVSTAVRAGSFKTLTAALKAGGLVETLQGDGPFTVFAPSDEAFAHLPKATLQSLLQPENKDALVSVLTFHVVPGVVSAAQAATSSGAVSFNGQKINFEATADGRLSVNGAAVSSADIQCSNGVIHVIDRVIQPTGENIVDVAASAGVFSTLLKAATEAGLAEALAGDGPFTVLAPTDDAFSALPAGAVQTLLRKENLHKLSAILKHHVISGRAYARDAIAAREVESLNGDKILFDIRDGRLTAGGANVVATDIDASNGVIHIIDRVIVPSM